VEWKQKQNKGKSIAFHVLMISTELKGFKLFFLSRNSIKCRNLALIEKELLM